MRQRVTPLTVAGEPSIDVGASARSHYPEVDLDVLWDTMEHDLPHLEEQIRQHLDDTTPDNAE